MFKRSIIKFNSFTYDHFAKPILFSIPPDKIHNMMISSASLMSKSSLILKFVGSLYNNEHQDTLSQTYHGIKFTSPIGLSAGLDKNGEIVPMMARTGLGFATVGSVTAEPCTGNVRPWFYRLPNSKSIVVNAGLGNQGSKVILERISSYKKFQVDNFPIVLSVAKTNSREVVSVREGIDDYVATIKRAKSVSKVKMFEINISCPNTYGGEPFTFPDRLNKLLSAIDALKVSQPIFVKMPVDLSWSDTKALLEVIVKHKIAGVTISNLTKDRSLVSADDKLPDSVRGHLSGKPTQTKSNELIRQTYLSYGDRLTIIGVGGTFTAEDAYQKIKLGANLVDVITGLIYNGPQFVSELNNGIYDLLQKDGYKHISEAIGVDAKK